MFLSGMTLYTYYLTVRNATGRKYPDTSMIIDSGAHKSLELKDSGDELIQSFIADYEGIRAVEIYMDCEQDSVVTAELVYGADVIEEWKITREDVKDGGLVKLKLDTPLSDVEDHIYTLRLYYESGEKVNVVSTEEDAYQHGLCFLNGVEQNGDLQLTILPCKRDYHVLKKYFFLIAAFMLVGFVLVYFLVWRDKAFPLEWLFVVFMFTYGVAYLLALPPFSAPDEMRHFATAYHISNVILGYEENDPNYPVSREEDHSRRLSAYPSSETYRYIADDLFEAAGDTTVSSYIYVGDMIRGIPLISHLPQAIGITVARLLNVNYVSTVYFGQFFIFLLYVVMVFFAIKLIPVGKYILFVLAGMPLTLQQTASMSYDTITIAFAFLFTAYALHFIYTDNALTWKSYVMFCLLTILFAPCKMVYCFVTILVILIPEKRFHTRLHASIFKLVIPVMAVLSAVMSNSSNISGTGGENYIAWANEPGYTVGYLLTHISRLIEILVNTYHDKMAMYAETFFGTRLGWMEIPIPFDLTVGFVVLVVLAVTAGQGYVIRPGHKVVYTGLFIMISGLLAASMLLGWTPMSYRFIEGLQGRYFIPIMPLILLCFYQKNRSSITKERTIIVGTLVLNYLVILRVFEYICSR